MMRAVVIDDDGDFIAMVTAQLEKAGGMTVEAFRLGRTALDHLLDDGAAMPDIVICDLLLPDLSGFELVSALRKHPRTKAVACVVVSARSGLEEHARAEEVGADAFLEKPFRAKQLLELIRSTVTARRAR